MPSKPVGQYDPAGIATKGGKNVIREGMTAVVTGGARELEEVYALHWQNAVSVSIVWMSMITETERQKTR